MALFKKLLSALGLASRANSQALQAAQTDALPAKQAASRNEWVNKVAEDYAGVAAGVEINRICSILSPTETEKLEQDLKKFTDALSGQIHSEFLILARRTSKAMASEEPYSLCGADAKQAVADAQELVAWWLNELVPPERKS